MKFIKWLKRKLGFKIKNPNYKLLHDDPKEFCRKLVEANGGIITKDTEFLMRIDKDNVVKEKY